MSPILVLFKPAENALLTMTVRHCFLWNKVVISKKRRSHANWLHLGKRRSQEPDFFCYTDVDMYCTVFDGTPGCDFGSKALIPNVNPPPSFNTVTSNCTQNNCFNGLAHILHRPHMLFFHFSIKIQRHLNICIHKDSSSVLLLTVYLKVPCTYWFITPTFAPNLLLNTCLEFFFFCNPSSGQMSHFPDL